MATALSAVVAAAGIVFPAGSVAAESNGGVRVMLSGDSDTGGTQVPGGYHIGLWQRTAAAGYRVDLVAALRAVAGAVGDPGTGTGGALVGAASGRCLDVPGGDTANGTQPIIWTCSAANQRWSRV